MNNHEKDIAICEAATDDMCLFEGVSSMYIKHFNPKKVRKMLERIQELEAGIEKIEKLSGNVNYSQSDVECDLQDAVDIARELLRWAAL